MTLKQWLKNPGPNQLLPIKTHEPLIGIHDIYAIREVRTYLWDLSDYRVSSVSGGVIWLAPKDMCSMCEGFGSREYANTGKVQTCPRCKGTGKANKAETQSA